MAGRIDPLIDLYFRDRVEALGPTSECLVSVARGVDIDALAQQYGATVVARGEQSAAISASPAVQEQLFASESTVTVVPLNRPAEIAVLVRVQDPEWRRDIAGFTRGSQIGSIITGVATRSALEALMQDPAVISVEASRNGGAAECAASMPFVGASTVHSPPLVENGAGALVAVIDSGIDVLHEAFHRVSAGVVLSRIVAVWDQRSTGTTPSQASAAGTAGGANYVQNYGRYHSRADIDGYIAAGAVPVGFDRDPQGHGTHVASIAAGSPLAGFPGGVAPQADIVVVIPKLSASPGDPLSLGYSVSHVDALAFVKQTAVALGKPVAVNVSLGMNAGAHDGSSLLELAFDEFSGGGRVPGYVLVKSAGNEQLQDVHAQVHVANGATALVEWVSQAFPRAQDFIEFWCASSDDLAFTLRAPNGRTVVVDRAHPTAALHLASGDSCYLTLERFYHDNGDTRLLALVRRNDNTALTLAGNWLLTVRGNSVVSGGRVDGWIERDNQRALRFTRGQAAGGTISIPGTARTVVCVGACDVAAPLVNVQPFSSHGPTRDGRHKPELVAPGHDIVAAEAGTSSGLIAQPGTSMAAPHVTGAVALLQSHRRSQGQPLLNAAQIRSALSQCLGGFNGRWDDGRGYGWLDIPALLRAF